MTITHLAAGNYRRMPWKNGGGETVEIARFPVEAELEDFSWRISMATVAADGPFSIFPGIDRTLAVLSGDPMRLAIGTQPGEGHLLETRGPPMSFPADIPVTAQLTGGPITDLNLMTRRGAFTHHMQVLPLSHMAAGSEGALVFLLVAGDAMAEIEGRKVPLKSRDCLLLDKVDDRVALTGSGPLYRMDICPVIA